MKSCIVSVILGLSGAAPVWAHADHDHAAVQMQATRSSEYLALPDIPVTDTAERREGFVSRYAEVGPVLISFIYTECVEACSMVRAIMGMVDQEITRPDAPRLRLVAVSVDPARDTPASLAAAASEQQASANWDWLVASQTDTPALLSAFGLRPGPIEAHESVYLLGDFRTGQFWRISGVPDPAELVDLARSMAP